MRRLSYLATVLAAAAFSACAAAKSTSTVLLNTGDWQVRSVRWDDGASACVAEVSNDSDTFSVWEDRAHPARLQFYSTSWDFAPDPKGGDQFRDLAVKIDDHQVWNLHNADLYKQSILFDLPTGDSGAQFLNEVAGSKVLLLEESDGTQIRSYSLTGAGQSIGALKDCVSKL